MKRRTGWMLIFALLGGSTGAVLLRGAVPVCATPTTVGQAGQGERESDGYRDLVAAAAALGTSERFRQAVRGKPTLAEKQAVLKEPPVARALALVRRGLKQKIVLPPLVPESSQEGYARMADFRNLARLLAMQQSVQLEEGRTGEAIETARLAMRLGRAVHEGPLIWGLVGVAIRALPVGTFASHLDRLSASDCERLLGECRKWLNEPDLFPRVLATERKYGRRWLPPELAGAGDVHAELDRVYDQVLAEWKKPAWERVSLEAKDQASIGGRLAANLIPPLIQATQVYTREQARLRLLACHAAIRRYRLQHGKLPATLTTLEFGKIGLDPFAGKTLEYATMGDRYRLTSVGPKAAPDDPRAVNGRLPVSLPTGP